MRLTGSPFSTERQRAAALLAVLFLIRAVLPAGYMAAPAQAGTAGIVFIICHGGDGETERGTPGAPEAPAHPMACPLAAPTALMLPPEGTPALPARRPDGAARPAARSAAPHPALFFPLPSGARAPPAAAVNPSPAA